MRLQILQAVDRPALAQIPCKEQRQSISRSTLFSWNGVHVGEQGLGFRNCTGPINKGQLKGTQILVWFLDLCSSAQTMEMKPNILMGRYELGRLLGQGTFAKVYYAKTLKTGESVAIKVMDKEKMLKVGMIEQIKREISVMRLVRHPNIVRLYEVMASKYVKGGELFSRVIEKGKLKEEEARKYFQQLISAVDFCHSRGVYHRDLKPENLLLYENGDMKVSDFGLSALPEQFRQDGLLHTACGTPAYVSPEVITKKGYDRAKVDIWSCGIILFGQALFSELSTEAAFWLGRQKSAGIRSTKSGQIR